MKLVELLATNLDLWARTTEFYVQDPNGTIYPCSSTPYWDRAWCGATGFIDQNNEAISKDIDLSSDHDTAIVTRKMWQAERDRQKGGEWKRHHGNSQPVDEGTYVEVKLRCGDIQQGLANAFLWRHFDCDVAANIMKYRVISQPQAEEVEYRGPFPCAPIGETVNAMEFDIEFPSGSCSVESKTDQMETPFKWRDEVTELNAYIEKFTRERDALIERLASEGFALIPPVVSVMSEFEGVDMSDYRNWVVGSHVIVSGNYGGYDSDYFKGVSTVTCVDPEDTEFPIEINNLWFSSGELMSDVMHA